jgi:hypothetical protein
MKRMEITKKKKNRKEQDILNSSIHFSSLFIENGKGGKERRSQ